MNFMKGNRYRSKYRESQIKAVIISQLSDYVKEIQMFQLNESYAGQFSNLNDASESLCSVIEAMFLHGLRDSLARKVRRALADADTPPKPTFWPPILVLSHRDIVDQINKLSQINTETGQCRTWIRLSLNESLLSSYLSSIRSNLNCLKAYYSPQAFMRDSECLEVAERLIIGVETMNIFSIPCNSSLLNNWPLPTLQLAGLYSPSVKTVPISAGIDIASNLMFEPKTLSESSSLYSINSSVVGLNPMHALNEEEALKIILSKTPDSTEGFPLPKYDLSNEPSTSALDSDQCMYDSNERAPSPAAKPATVSEVNSALLSSERSYDALIESYTDNLKSGESTPKTGALTTIPQPADIEKVIEPDFEVIPSDRLEEPSSKQYHIWYEKIPNELGLDAQEYACFSCRGPILYAKPKVCAFNGKYYCPNCINSTPTLIPSRVIFNWDFKTYFVAKKSYEFLQDVTDEPLIDIKSWNPGIYSVIQEMARLELLRVQLHFLREYIYTCRQHVVDQFKEKLKNKDYLCDHIHRYALSDLGGIVDGTLHQYLENLVNFGKEHVLGCSLCILKGHICEVCKDAKIIYPFDTHLTYRCKKCGGFFHRICLNSYLPCPKCERKSHH